MSGALVLGCLWVLLASAIALLPQRFHWPGAGVLIVLGIPLVGFITWQTGPVWGLIALAGGMSVLRWPLIRAGQWVLERLRALPGPVGEKRTRP